MTTAASTPTSTSVTTALFIGGQRRETADTMAIANPAKPGTRGGGSGGAIYVDGKDDDVLIAGTLLEGNRAREGGGAVFDVVDSGWGALTFRQSRLHGNVSEGFETFPGVFYQLDGRDLRPRMVGSTAD